MIHDIVIIGAGLSGLSAARHLVTKGPGVLILEKSRGVSGRAATRRVDLPDGTYQGVDHGAQFFTARDPLFRKQLNEWLLREICFEWATGFHTWGGSCLYPSERQWESPRYACRQGMSALGNDLASGLRVERNFHVGSVVKNREHWIIYPRDSDSGNPIHARALFCSAPVPQSLELLGKYLSEEQRWNLGRIAYGRCLAVMTLFDGMPITPDWKGIQVRDPGSILSWIAWDSSKRGQKSPRESIVLHASPKFSAQERIITIEGKERALHEMIQEAARVAGNWMRSPASAIAHLWHYAIPLEAGMEEGYLRSAREEQLYLIGDGLQGGRIEGAWLSGFKAAQDYLERHG